MQKTIIPGRQKSCLLQPKKVVPAQRSIRVSFRQRNLRRTYQKQPVVNQAASQSTDGGQQDGQRHAILHDFCMMIPYGFIAFLCGGVSLLFKGGEAGMILAGCGLAVLLMAYASLSVWKKGESSILYTFVSTLLSGIICWQMWQRVQLHMAWLPSMIMMILSAAAALFGIYNMLAGGNPPKKLENQEPTTVATQN